MITARIVGACVVGVAGGLVLALALWVLFDYLERKKDHKRGGGVDMP